jgi:hypothetical protein
MNKPIRTYEGLLQAKQQAEVLLHAQQELIRYDVADISNDLRQQLKPAADVISVMGKLVTKNPGSLLLAGGANQLIDGLLRKVLLLTGSGWLARLILPVFVKNYSSHYIAEHKHQWLKKLFSWIGPRHHNGKVAPETEKEPEQDSEHS